MGKLAGMRIAAMLVSLAALSLASACGSGCGHGNHSHATGSTWEAAPTYTESCTCGEDGEISCGTSGGSAEVATDEVAL